MSLKVSRRLFFPVALGFALTAGGSTPRPRRSSVEDIFIEIQSDVDNPEAAVRHFVQTDFLGLLCAYNDFYPILRDGLGVQAIHVLKDTIKRIGPHFAKNERRLQAMPALMAIHLLSRTANREPLETEILSTLERHPHTRELILQNLITATLPSSDAITHIPVTPPLIAAVGSNLRSSITNPQFFQDAGPALQYLLNGESLFRAHDRTNPVLRQINRAFASVETSRSPATRELKLLIAEHRALFSHPVFSDPLSLSPQITEIMYGMDSLPSSWRRYAEILTLINARMFHNHFTVWKANTPAHGLTATQAEESVGKSVRFWREGRFLRVLERAGITEHYAGRGDQRFQMFLHRDLRHILDNAEKEGLDVANLAGGEGYSSTVGTQTFPLVRYRLDARFTSEARTMHRDDQTWLGQHLGDLGVAVMAGAIIEIIKWRLDKMKHPAAADGTRRMAHETVETKVENYVAKTTEGLQKQQNEIGPIEIDLSGGNGKSEPNSG